MKLPNLPAATSAFTYVELMIVLGIVGVLLSLSVLSIRNLIPDTDVRSQAQTLLADTTSMQLKSMRREVGSAGQTTPFGIYFASDTYVLFQGSSYDVNGSDNVIVALPEGLTFSSISVPNNTLLFERGSGGIINYDANASSLVLSHVGSGKSIVAQFNAHGILELIE